MKVICAWCQSFLREVDGPTDRVSHGMCPTCAADWLKPIDLSTLGGPAAQPTHPADCPGYGRELPPFGWACWPGCPIAKPCYEASQVKESENVSKC